MDWMPNIDGLWWSDSGREIEIELEGGAIVSGILYVDEWIDDDGGAFPTFSVEVNGTEVWVWERYRFPS